MKTLKRTLCLALTVVMLFSLAAFSASADFTDKNDIQNTEATTVLNALDVMVGDETGAFNPGKSLTRAEGATIVAKMLLGAKTAAKMTATSAPFVDVATSHWAAGYIAYCATEGICSGYGDGTFGPDDTLTVTQFAKMLLNALGYANSEFSGSGWELSVAKLAVKNDLLDNVDTDYTAACTRDDAAQMALNTIKADMVEYDSGDITVSAGDATVTIGASSAKTQANNKYDGQIDATKDGDGVLQFGECYFTDLEYTEKTAGTGDFGRPNSYTWELSDDEIYSGASDTNLLASYTTGVSKGTLYTLVGKTVVNKLADTEDESELTVYVDGVKQTGFVVSDYFKSGNTTKIGGNGTLTEVYMDDDNNVTIVIINTYLAIAEDDYDSDDEQLKIELYGYTTDSTGDKLDDTVQTLDLEDFDIAGYEEDDYLLVTVDGDEIYSVEPATEVTGTITAYTSGSNVSVDSTKYSFGKMIDTTEFPTTSTSAYDIDDDITLLVDQYGYVLGYTDVDAEDTYLYVAEIAKTGSLSSSGYTAGVYYTDGTYEEIAVKSVDGNTPTATTVGGWYSYSINSAGKLVLTTVSGAATLTADTKYETVNGKINFLYESNAAKTDLRANSSTVFVVLDDDDDATAYTGYKNVPTVNSSNAKAIAVSYIVDDGYVTYCFVDASAGATIKGGTSSTDEVIYVYRYSWSTAKDSDGNTYYANNYALVNGEKTTITTTITPTITTTTTTTQKIPAVGLYIDVTYDADGYIDSWTQITVANTDDDDDVYCCGTFEDAYITYDSDVLTIVSEDGSTTDLALDDCTIYTFEIDDENSTAQNIVVDYDTITATRLAKTYKSSSSELFNATVYVVQNDDDEATAIYIDLT